MNNQYQYQFNDEYNKEIQQLINENPNNYFHILKCNYSQKYKKSFTYLLKYIANNSPIIFQNPKYNIKYAIEWVLNKRLDFPKCQLCGKILTADNFNNHTNTYFATCSKSCAHKFAFSKLSIDQISERSNKRLDTMLQIYHTTNTNQFKSQQKYTISEKGKLSLKLIRRAKTFDTVILTDPNYIPLFTKEDYLNKDDYLTTIFEFQCKKCGTIFKTWYFDNRHLPCPKCYPKIKSKGEVSIIEFIKTFYTKEIITNKRFLYTQNNKFPKELDIFLPDINIAIEYNGVYWHSIKKSNDDLIHPENNHIFQKTILTEQYNITLIHIFEDEWLYNNDNIKYILQNIILQKYQNILMQYLQSNNNVIMLPRDKFNLTLINNICLATNHKILKILTPTYINHIVKKQEFLIGNSGYIMLI